MMNELKFKRGKFVKGYKTIGAKKIPADNKRGYKLEGGIKVQRRKLELSKPECVDWYDLDDKHTFVLLNQKKTISHPLACGVAVLGISKSIMGSFWYKLKDKFGDRVQLIYTDTYSLVFSLDGKTYKEANLLSYIETEPEFAEDFDLTDIPDVPKIPPVSNPYWSMKNKKVMMKFKFEVLNIAEIGAPQPKTNSILVADKNDKLKTKLTLKGADNCCIDDDCPKRNKKLEELEGGVIHSDEKKQKNEKASETLRYDCLCQGRSRGPKIEAYRIESVKGDGIKAHKMITKKHSKYTFSVCDTKRFQREDYHTLAYGHKDDNPLIQFDEVRRLYHLKIKANKKDGG